MTNEEATKQMQTFAWNQTGVNGELQREAVVMAIKALEKQIPKKPALLINNDFGTCECPNCYKVEFGFDFNKPKYCEECGQAIDWSEK